MALKNLLPMEYVDPVSEAIEHVHELAAYSQHATLGDIVENAFDELNCQEVSISLTVVDRVMQSVFGSRHDVQTDYRGYTDSELAMLHPGITGKLLSWYVQRP